MNDERSFERTARAWLAFGPDQAPERAVQAALLAVETTPQERDRGLPRAFPTSIRLRVGIAAVVGLLMIGSTINLLGTRPADPGAMPDPTPTPSAATSKGPALSPSTDYVVVGSQAGGYELLIPRSWQEVASGFDDARTWTGSDGSLMISYGASIFDGGAVTVCGPPTPEWPTCTAEEFSYSIPYNADVDGVAPLSIKDFVRDRCLGGCDVTVTETTLGGDVAEQSSTTAAGERVTYVSTFHDRRPVILYWSEPAPGSVGADRIDRMRTSFRFLDAPVVSPTPLVDPTELIPYVNRELGYEILIPRYWAEGSDHPGQVDVHEFGAGRGFGTGGDPALTISVGAPDGTVSVCQEVLHLCRTEVAATLDDLDELLVSVPAQFKDGVPAETTGELDVAGQAGRFKRPGYSLPANAADGIGDIAGGNCLGCPGMLYHAYTVRDGRPIVISIDYWTIAFGEMTPDYIREIVASVRLTD